MYYWQNMQLKNLPQEKWVDVIGFDGYYEVSNFGRVKSLAREIDMFPMGVRYTKEKIKKISKQGNSLMAVLCADGTKKTYPLAKLVALHFIKNYADEPLWYLDNDKCNVVTSNLIILNRENYKQYFENSAHLITKELARFMTSLDERRCCKCYKIQSIKNFYSMKKKRKGRNINLSNLCRDCRSDMALVENRKKRVTISNESPKYTWENEQLNDLPNEKWSDLEGFENSKGRYQISNMARVKRIIPIKRRKFDITKTSKHIRSPKPSKGGPHIDIWLNKKYKTFDIKKLVAKHFLSGYEDKVPIWFKDGDLKNVQASNLVLINDHNYKDYFNNNSNYIGRRLARLMFKNGEKRCYSCKKIVKINEIVAVKRNPSSIGDYGAACKTCYYTKYKY